MSPEVQPAHSNQDFEFSALAEANNYRRAIADRFAGFIRGNVLEVGAGIGQFTPLLRQTRGVDRVAAIEPDRRLAAQHRLQFPEHEVVDGFIEDAPPGVVWDSIVSINVLEHIEGDAAELRKYANLLAASRGHLCLFVPARPEIYSPIDGDFGHFRRYKREDVRALLQAAQFEVLQIEYFNLIGYFAWWFNFRVLKKRAFERSKVRFFDRYIFPRAHHWETKHRRPPFGQSIIAVARAKAG